MPKISIITPAYIDTPDKLTWLREMLQSVQAQRFTDWEAVIVDDCSPLSLDPLKQEFSDPTRFRWLRTASQSGPALCRNTAAALAEGAALLPIDADDLLADNDTLSVMVEAWEAGKSRVVYGDLQRLENGQRGKVFNLSEYTFQRSLDFNGIMPVTALHSKEAHIKAGGWKPDLDAGLEDVEYWIACGKAGFCGHRIHSTTLLYRRHETSRSFGLRHISRRETEMRNKILEIHRDVYEGRYPMGCCGGGSSYVPPQNGGQAQMNISTPLTEFTDNQKQWVQYMGQREGAFSVVGDFTGIHYTVNGPGHKFEAHINDLPKFRRSGRGRDFAVGVAQPVELAKPVLVEIPVVTNGNEYRPPEPALAQIERLDTVGAASRGVALPPEPAMGPVPMTNSQATYDLTALELGEKIQSMLEAESWTVERLAEANLEELKAYPGIGPKMAKNIIERAAGINSM